MAGSIDINTNKGIAALIGLVIVTAGGASALQNELFGPGGEWQRVVSQQSINGERINSLVDSNKQLTSALEKGFDKIVDAIDGTNKDLIATRETVLSNTQEISYLKQRVMELNKELDVLEGK
jgi:hypothetical protein